MSSVRPLNIILFNRYNCYIPYIMKHSLTFNNLTEALKNEPAYRKNQVFKAFFSCRYNNFLKISTLSKDLRDFLNNTIHWSTIKNTELLSSNDKKTFKAIITLYDDNKIETVLIPNLKNSWTICVSTQIGCPIKCSFCATGKMDFIRNLDSLEIAEQFCFWNKYIHKQQFKNIRISNIVLMGMGEPLLNYENVKTCINLWLSNTDIGTNNITLSTAGILPIMNKLLDDPEWPKIKIAISLHAASDPLRSAIVPSHTQDFFPKLKKWCRTYTDTLGARTRPLTFEYVMLNNTNDSPNDAEKLIKFLKGLERIKVNLIPFNTTYDDNFKTATDFRLAKFKEKLNQSGITTTIRKSFGQDIDAACGQLISRMHR